ncbi:MAG: hypothetical protein HY074_18040 [Deltaproteobacteria bacterium]|nr:hypothetical protein [Deltaproteobacteria bacterium]
MKNTTAVLAVALLGSVLAAGCGRGQENKPGASRKAVAPSQLNNINLAEVMASYPSAVVTPQPWAGYWFPYTASGIYSAAAKYDEANLSEIKARGGSTADYQPLAVWEAGNHGPSAPRLESWFGHCNGWAASAISVPEPRAGKMIDGIEFSVGDLKALLAESWLEFAGDFVGTRVNDKQDFSTAAFWDVVPAQFHLMLVNLVGKQNRGLIIDRHTGAEIWNQPLVAYKFEPVTPNDYLGPHPSYPDIYRVNMTARIWWANDNVSSEDITPPFNMATLENEMNDYFYPGRILKYELWLDGPVQFDEIGKMTKSGDILVTQENGKFVGGIWKNGVTGAALVNTHPDYMWVPYALQHSTGYKNPRIDDGWVRANIESVIRTNGGN